MKKFSNLPVVWGILFFLIQIPWGSATTRAADRPRGDVIEVEGGRLTVVVKDTALIDILTKVSQKTGIGFEIHGKVDRKVTAGYIKIPLPEGFKRLLDPYSYVILYTDKKSPHRAANIKNVIIFGKPGSDRVLRITKGQTSATAALAKESSKKKSLVETDAEPDEEPEKSLEAYARQLKDPDSDIREEAVDSMAEEYGGAALNYLEEALLHDADADVRATAAETIGNLETEGVVDVLARGLDDPDEDVREAVVEALAEIGGKQALPALRQALEDRNEDIREAAADAIEEIEEAEKEAKE